MTTPGDNRGDRYEVSSLCRPLPGLIALLLLLFAQQVFAQTSIGITPGVAASTSTSTVSGVTMPSDFSTSVSGGVVTVSHSGQSCDNTNTPCTVTSGWLRGNATSTNVTFNLPVANAQQIPISACKTDSSVNTVTMHRNGTDTINGAASDYVLSTQHQCVELVSTSAGNWSVRGERWASGSMPAAQISGTALTASNNLSDLTSVTTAQTNLALGTAATANLPAIGAPGSFSSLVDPVWHAAPTASGTTNLSCTGISGNFPYNDIYSGALSGNNVTYNLPTSGCADFSIITEVVEQDAAHTLTNTTSASGGITGTQTWTLGTSAGNLIIQQFMWFSPLNAWFAMSVGTNPVQAFPVPTGGTGRLTLTNHSVLLGAGSGALTQLGPNSSTGKPLLSQGSSADPAFPSFTFSDPPNLGNSQYFSQASGATQLSIPTGATYCELTICSGGAGGGGIVTGNSTACSGAGGSSGECSTLGLQTALMTYTNPLTISIGAGGSAGSNSATAPTTGGNGGSTSITINGITLTDTGGTAAGTAENSACNATTGTGSGGGGLGVGSQLPVGVTIRANQGGTNGTAGAATSSVHYTSTGNAGGFSGTNTAGNSATAPTAGNPGFINFNCAGATAY